MTCWSCWGVLNQLSNEFAFKGDVMLKTPAMISPTAGTQTQTMFAASKCKICRKCQILPVQSKPTGTSRGWLKWGLCVIRSAVCGDVSWAVCVCKTLAVTLRAVCAGVCSTYSSVSQCVAEMSAGRSGGGGGGGGGGGWGGGGGGRLAVALAACPGPAPGAGRGEQCRAVHTWAHALQMGQNNKHFTHAHTHTACMELGKPVTQLVPCSWIFHKKKIKQCLKCPK